jgi:O-antigen biosynthesis protein
MDYAMTSPLKVSVIVPCLDGYPSAARAFTRLLNCTGPRIELIGIVFGGEPVSMLRPSDDRFRLVRAERGSLGHARNVAALTAVGDALWFVDHPDELDPALLSRLTAALTRSPGGVAICSGSRSPVLTDGDNVAPVQLVTAVLRAGTVPARVALFSRNAFQGACGWDELVTACATDDLLMRCAFAGAEFTAVRDQSPSPARDVSRRPRDDRGLWRDELRSRVYVALKIGYWLNDDVAWGQCRPALIRSLRSLAQRSLPDNPDLYRQCQSFLQARGRTWRLGSVAARWQRARPRSGSAAIASGHAHDVAPRVSVILPADDHSCVRALHQLSRQTFRDFEVLVIRQRGSTSTHGQAAYRMCQRQGVRVRLLECAASCSPAAAWNRGLQAACGEFVAFMHVADIWDRHKLARQVAALAAAPARVGLVHCDVDSVVPAEQAPTNTPGMRRGDLFGWLLLENVVASASCVLMRHNVVRVAGLFDPGLPALEEHDYWLRAARSYQFERIPEKLVGRRRSMPWDTDAAADPHTQMHSRERFFHKHGAEMRRAGTAERFLLQSAQWHASGRWHGAARQLALRAITVNPWSSENWSALWRHSVRYIAYK